MFSKFIVQPTLDKSFVYFLDNSENFWQTTDWPEEIRKPLKKVLCQALLLQKTYYYFGCVTASLVILSPFALKGIDLPFGTFTMQDQDTFHHIIQFLQSTLIPIWAIFAMSTDCIFVGLSANMITQFKLLNLLIKRLDFYEDSGKMMEKIKVYVAHHNFLAR